MQYFQVLDLITGEISRRFDQKTLALPLAVEEVLISAANKSDDATVEVPAVVAQAYANDVNVSKLKHQLQMLPDLASAYKQTENLKLLKISTIRTIADMLQKVPMANEMFGEVGKLVRLHFTIPVTTATAERTFSALRRVKTYLRSTMTEERLNNVMLLHTHKDLATELDLIKVASIFVSANSRRQAFFGRFA